MTNESKGMFLGLLGVTAFGLTLPITRLVVQYLDPVFIGLGRAMVAAVAAAMILLLFPARLPSKNQLARLAIVALGVVVGFPVLSSCGMQTLPASHGGVVIAILPLATAVVGAWLDGERPSTGFWLSAAAGTLLVLLFSALSGGAHFESGDIALLGAALSAAIGYAVGAQLAREMGGWRVICWSLVLSFPFITGPALLHAPTIAQINFPLSVWLGFFYLALISQLSAFFLWYKGLALGGIARVSQAQLVQPLVTLLVSAALLGEPMTPQVLIFALLIMTTVALGKKMPVLQRA